MEFSEMRQAFEEKLAKARREALDASQAHWAAGYLELGMRRVELLIAAGSLAGFAGCEAGVSGRRVPGREMAMFKDGTGLVALAPDAPWECAGCARGRLARGEELWLCLRLRAAPGRWSSEGPHFWCCCRAEEGKWADAEAFWEEMSMEVARAQAALASAAPESLGLCVRLDALAERAMIGEAAMPGGGRQEPMRL